MSWTRATCEGVEAFEEGVECCRKRHGGGEDIWWVLAGMGKMGVCLTIDW